MSSFTDYLTSIVVAIRSALSAHAARSRAHGDMLAFLWNYTNRTAQRLERLYTLWQQGKLKPLRPRIRAFKPVREPENTPPSTPRLRLSRRRGWLVHLIPEGAPAGGRLCYFLQREDAVAFLTAVPRAQRLLRPLCRLHGVDLPAFMQLPPRPPRPRKPRPPRPGVRGGKYPRFNPLRYSPGRIPTFKKPATAE